jgi:hypothetical protein
MKTMDHMTAGLLCHRGVEMMRSWTWLISRPYPGRDATLPRYACTLLLIVGELYASQIYFIVRRFKS